MDFNFDFLKKIGSGIKNTFGNMSDGGMTGKDWASTALGAGGAALNAIGANQDRKENQAQFKQAQGQNAAQFGVNATQLDPFSQQKQRQKQAMVAQLMGGFTPATFDRGTNQFSGGLQSITADTFKGAMPFFGEDAMRGAERSFTDTVQAASPTYKAPTPGSVGYGGAAGGGNSANTPANKTYNLSMPEVGPGKGAKIGAGVGGLVGGLLPGGGLLSTPLSMLGNYIGGKTYTEGEKVNDLRDQFKGQFGDSAGNGLLDAVNSRQEALPDHDATLDAYHKFMGAGKQDELQSQIAKLMQIFGQQQGGSPSNGF
jgi:hypothetical protein